MNFLLPKGTRPVVTGVLKDSPALNAGLEPNDIFLKINNTEVYSYKQATKIIKGNAGTQLPVVILRGSDTLSLSVTPGEDGMIGIGIAYGFTGNSYYKTSGFFESFTLGWLDIVKMTDLTFNMLGKVYSQVK